MFNTRIAVGDARRRWRRQRHAAPEHSVAGLPILIGKPGPQDNGRFYYYQGKPIPW